MTNEQEQRLQLLAHGPCITGDYVRDYYGLEWPFLAETAKELDHYHKFLPRPRDCGVGRVSRTELEGLMMRSGVESKKWMAVRLGMTVASLDELLPRLEDFGMQRSRYEFRSEFIAELLADDLVRQMPGLRVGTFGDHDAFCQRLHRELKTIGLDVDPLFCATSKTLGESPRRYASYFDCLTLEPVSIAHTVWLDFRRPLYSLPDRCSKLLYVENRGRLRPFITGGADPDNLGQYEAFLGEAQHA